MMLSDRDIKAEMRERIVPWDYSLVQPASYDLTLGDEIKWENSLGKFLEARLDETFVLGPGEFALGHTEQWMYIPLHLSGRCEGKSTLGRQGLMVHCTAGFIDPGFYGQITLELFNLSKKPIILRNKMKIAQLSLYKLSSTVEKPYGSPGLGSKYQFQEGATEAR